MRSSRSYYYNVGNQSCYDLDLGSNGYHLYSLNVSLANNLYTLTVGPSSTFHSFNMPQCSCENDPTYDECEQQGQMDVDFPSVPRTPYDAFYFHGPNQGPSCYDIVS